MREVKECGTGRGAVSVETRSQTEIIPPHNLSIERSKQKKHPLHSKMPVCFS